MQNGGKKDLNNEIFMLGEWRIDPALNRIARAEKSVQLEPRAMMVLLYLASKPEEVFSRSEIMDDVWTDSIVNDEALTRIISLLRQALEDDPKKPRFIETIYKRGYRMLAIPGKVPSTPASVPANPTILEKNPNRRPLMVSAVLVVLVLAVVLGIKMQGSKPAQTNSWDTAWIQTPLTSYPGFEFFPAISPDGSRVAFAMSGPQGSQTNLWIKEIDTDSTFTLPTQTGFPFLFAWSPDCGNIAYVNNETPKSIRLVSLEDGTDRELFLGDFPLWGLDWSSDGKKIVISMRGANKGALRLHLIHLDDNSIQCLTSAPIGVGSDIFPAFSPDGRQLAFCRRHRNLYNRIHILSLINGDVEVLKPEFGKVTGLDWASDGKRLLIASFPEEIGLLQFFDFATGLLQEMNTQTSDIEGISSAQAVDRIVVTEIQEDIDILAVDLRNREDLRFEESDFNSTKNDRNPAFSPDGTKTAFVSLRSGFSEIMVKDSADLAPRRLAQLKNWDVSNFFWSPDGKFIAANAISPDCTRVVVLDLDGNSSIISSEGCRDIATSWSADGTGIFIQSDRSGEEMTWLIRRDGSDPEIVMPHPGVVLGERASSGNLVFLQRRRTGIWQRDLTDGSEHELIGAEISQGWFLRHLKGERVFFAKNLEKSTILGYFDLETSLRVDFVELPIPGIAGFSLSPNDYLLLIARNNRLGSDLVLLDAP